MKKLTAMLLVSGLVLCAAVFVGCELLNRGFSGTWDIQLQEIARSHWGHPPWPAQWDTQLVLTDSGGKVSGYLEGYETYPLTGAMVDGKCELNGDIDDIDVSLWDLTITGSDITYGHMRWGLGNYGPWKTWRVRGHRQ
ncbi:MAG: hypothetical protein HQ559_13015 [Lentisphaerae bacterium]|nr:hypothetical protein [Lentisphaerota bacterium]